MCRQLFEDNKKPGAKYQHLGVRVEINNKKPNLSTETNQ